MEIRQFRETVMEQYDKKLPQYEAQINSNIEKHKKGDCTLRILDANGQPLAGKNVKINQAEHDFKYGANILLLDEFGTDEENKKYRDTFYRYFNLATVPFYWAELEPEEGKPRYAADSPKIYRRPTPDLCLDYCNEKGIAAKLHCLFYDKFTPAWLPKRDADAMMRLYEKRFSEIGARYNGKMYEYEVSNELLEEWRWHGDMKGSVLCEQKDTPLWCYHMARKYFPDGTLVLNEANRLPELSDMDYRSPCYMFIENLLLKGAPVDKIGMQNHIFCGSRGPQDTELPKFMKFFDPEKTMNGLRYLEEFGKPLEITEITIPTFGEGEEAEELQADLLKIMYRMWFSSPLMETIVYWNTVEGMAYKKPDGTANENNVRGGLFHRDITPKKSALAVKELFEKEWHTEHEGVTDENGVIAFRGFYGNYTANIDGNTVSFGIHKSDVSDICVKIG